MHLYNSALQLLLFGTPFLMQGTIVKPLKGQKPNQHGPWPIHIKTLSQSLSKVFCLYLCATSLVIYANIDVLMTLFQLFLFDGVCVCVCFCKLSFCQFKHEYILSLVFLFSSFENSYNKLDHFVLSLGFCFILAREKIIEFAVSAFGQHRFVCVPFVRLLAVAVGFFFRLIVLLYPQRQMMPQ